MAHLTPQCHSVYCSRSSRLYQQIQCKDPEEVTAINTLRTGPELHSKVTLVSLNSLFTEPQIAAGKRCHQLLTSEDKLS
jgi:hypothetical protein